MQIPTGGSFVGGGYDEIEDAAIEVFKQSPATPAGYLSGNEASIYIYAARYAHHRNTGAAQQVVNEILRAWDRMTEQVHGQLRREAQEASCNLSDWQRVIDR